MDDARRFVLPVALREVFGEQSVCATNLCIYADTQAWERKGGRSKIVMPLRIDRVWRTYIPLELRSYFTEKTVVLVWENDVLELWTKERWKEHLGEVIETA